MAVRAGNEAGTRAGFTMVELMVVIVIIGMMTMVVSPSIESMLPGERLNTTIRNLSADLRSIRSEAISRGVEFRLIYDLDNEGYCWSTPFSLDEGLVRQGRDEEWEESERVEFDWEKLPEGVEFTSILGDKGISECLRCLESNFDGWTEYQRRCTEDGATEPWTEFMATRAKELADERARLNRRPSLAASLSGRAGAQVHPQ